MFVPRRVAIEGPDPISDSVVGLSRMSYTTRDFIGQFHRVPVATDRIVRLSLVADRGLKATGNRRRQRRDTVCIVTAVHG